MGLLFLLAAILGLLFPPLAIVVLAAMVLAVFAKGVAAESPEQIVRARPKAKRRRREGRPRNAIATIPMHRSRGMLLMSRRGSDSAAVEPLGPFVRLTVLRGHRVSHQIIQKAEGTRFELATPCGAPHFQCGR